MGQEIPVDRPALAAALGADRAVLRVSGRHQKSHLHDQRRGVPEHDPAQGNQDPRLLPQRGSRHQVAVHGAAERGQEMAHDSELADRIESLRDSMGRPLPIAGEVTTTRTENYTILLTPPAVTN